MELNLNKLVLICLFLSGLFFENISLADTTEPLGSKSDFNMKIVEKGRYLVKIAGCNDCHTGGYLPSNGNVPVQQWLTGDSFGWRGPWGTTYASNLRLFVTSLSEEQWIKTAKTLVRRPPMPWYNLNSMKEEDLRSIYQFIRYLGPSGQPAPAYVPASEEPSGPYATFPAPPQ